jgi:hypothetical protein
LAIAASLSLERLAPCPPGDKDARSGSPSLFRHGLAPDAIENRAPISLLLRVQILLRAGTLARAWVLAPVQGLFARTSLPIMTKHAKYREHAIEAVKLAASATDAGDKALLLRIAQGWLDLAEIAKTRTIWVRKFAPRSTRRANQQDTYQ